jgi:hypothetical protein
MIVALLVWRKGSLIRIGNILDKAKVLGTRDC